ncbi:MAG: tRNA (adenosine(37)-N6)-threonylcarbamoyltransferase complex ATPase subunit type 1 TsaE [Neisseriaceae bacterium]|nr:tRNA (adenosine(37)-N6)-threonylcarbamoyltransferase complex ATPase subunit type 1 TsaE [Neisseriaceae bacterium]
MPPLEQSLFLPDEKSTIQLAEKWAKPLFSATQKQRVIVYLNGDLGVGKTTFVRGILRALGFQGAVKSPTYTLLETYRLPEITIFHFDLYRFSDPLEWEDAGFNDLLQNRALSFIEWSEYGKPCIPDADIQFNFAMQDNGRNCTIQSVLF